MNAQPRTVLSRRFGKHVQALRAARGLTQEMLAEAADLSPDTIRRLESRAHGFAPSLLTIAKLCTGLEISMATLFTTFEMRGRRAGVEQIRDALDFLSEEELEALRRFFVLLKRRGPGRGA